MNNPYRTLGVSSDASQKAIHRAFRALAKLYHPDTHPGNAVAEGRFKAMSEANDLLSDPNRRDRYDSWGKPEEPPMAMAEELSRRIAQLSRMRRKRKRDTAMLAVSVVVGMIGILVCVY